MAQPLHNGWNTEGTKRLVVHVQPDLKDWLEQRASTEGASVASVVRYALSHYRHQIERKESE